MTTKAPNKQYVLGFMFYANHGVVLIRKNKPAWQAGKLNGVGGKVEPGETPLQAMVREFEEETGFVSEADRWDHFCTMTWVDDIMGGGADVHVFSAHWFGADPPPVKSMTDEAIELHRHNGWMDTDHVPNVAWLIPLCLNATIDKPFTVEMAK